VTVVVIYLVKWRGGRKKLGLGGWNRIANRLGSENGGEMVEKKKKEGSESKKRPIARSAGG